MAKRVLIFVLICKAKAIVKEVNNNNKLSPYGPSRESHFSALVSSKTYEIVAQGNPVNKYKRQYSAKLKPITTPIDEK